MTFYPLVSRHSVGSDSRLRSATRSRKIVTVGNMPVTQSLATRGIICLRLFFANC